MTPCMLILTGLTTSRKNKEEGTLKERNIILEGKLKSWLLTVDVEKLGAKQQGQLILGLEKLYQATGDADYHTFAKKAVDNLVAEDGTYAKAEGSLSDNLFGNALFAVRAMDTVYLSLIHI